MEGALVAGELLYRKLPSEEWARLEPIFQVLNWYLPSPFLASCAVAENQEGEIVGLQVMQFILHAEPTWVAPNYRGKVYLKQLAAILDSIPKNPQTALVMPGYILVAEDDHIAELAKASGFTEMVGARVFKREWR